MAKEALSATSSSSEQVTLELEVGFGEEDELLYGGGSGWVEARTYCDHLDSLSADLVHIPTPDTPCFRCDHPGENWLCLCCKDVLCSRFVNKHMVAHNLEKGHSLALSFSDLSVWCYGCEAYLDAQVIRQLRQVYETTYLLKFGEEPPFRAVHNSGVVGSSNSS